LTSSKVVAVEYASALSVNISATNLECLEARNNLCFDKLLSGGNIRKFDVEIWKSLRGYLATHAIDVAIQHVAKGFRDITCISSASRLAAVEFSKACLT
jgi:hypothetical protein